MDAIPVIPDFTLIRCIGSGSYGDVWLGRSVTGIYRAVKIVDRSRFQDNRPFLREFDGIKRFQKAVGSQQQQLALLHVGCDEQAGVLYYVMELADDVEAGTDIDPATYVPATLKELTRRRAEPFPISECIAIGVSLGRALVGLHEAGLIHRDVKPSNIIFVGHNPKLADVGLVTSSEQTMTSLGTPGYAPPEGGGSIQGDIYSLGKILYELATGLGPEEFPRVPLNLMSTEVAPQMLELNEVFLRACDPVPALRYATARLLMDELLLLQAGRSVQELNRNRRRLKRLRRVAVTGGLFSLAAVTILGVRNYTSLRELAAKEIALRQLAESDDRAARYAADLHLARLGVSAGDFSKTRRALGRQIPDKGRPDLRGFEWYALWNESKGDATATVTTAENLAISALALSPDERFLAVQEGERPRDTVMWDINSRQRTLIAKETYKLGGFSVDGSRVTIGTEKKHVFEFELPALVRRPNQMVGGRILQQLPDRRTLLLNELDPGDKMIIWDCEAQRMLTHWQPEPRSYQMTLSTATVSPDHRLLAANFYGAQGALRIRDLVVYDLSDRIERFHLDDIDRVQCLRFSPDVRWLAIAMSNQPTRIVSSVTGETRQTLTGQSGMVSVVEFSPDGRMLASGGADRSLYVWDVESGACLRTFRGHGSDILSLAWFSDNARLVTGSRDGTWRTWSLSSKPINRAMGKIWADILGDFIFAPDGRSLAVTSEAGEIAIFDTYSLERTGSVVGGFQPLLYQENGRCLLALTKENTLVRHDFSDGATTPVNFHLENKQKLVVVEPSAAHQKVAFGFDQGAVEVWGFDRGESFSSAKFLPAQVGALAWAPDQPELVGGGENGPLATKIFNKAVSDSRWSAQKSKIYSLAYSADGEILAIGRADGVVALASRKTGEIVSLLENHSGPVSALAFSPDRTRLVTGSLDGTIIFWSLPSLRQVAIWTWEDDLRSSAQPGIYRLKFDLNGSRMAAMTEDGRLRIWHASPMP